MKIYFLFLLLLLPGAVFAQNLTGHYRASFVSPGFAEKTEAEFEVRGDGMVTGKIISGAVVVSITGQMPEDGVLKAESARENGTVYTLEADLRRRDGKITLTRRGAESLIGERTISQTRMEGNYQLTDSSPDAETTEPAGRQISELTVEQAHPLFDQRFASEQAKVILEKREAVNLIHLEMNSESVDDQSERGFYFTIAVLPDSDQTIWKAENIRALNYVEKTANFTKINRFRTDYESWLKNKEVMDGQIELLWKTDKRMAFAIKNLKIKNETGDDMVTINGKIYAEISY